MFFSLSLSPYIYIYIVYTQLNAVADRRIRVVGLKDDAQKDAEKFIIDRIQPDRNEKQRNGALNRVGAKKKKEIPLSMSLKRKMSVGKTVGRPFRLLRLNAFEGRTTIMINGRKYMAEEDVRREMCVQTRKDWFSTEMKTENRIREQGETRRSGDDEIEKIGEIETRGESCFAICVTKMTRDKKKKK